MALLHISLHRIDEAALQSLIRARVTESRSIDYKRETYGNAREDYAEFLADISSFANTAGGDIVIGMTATDGIPTATTPFQGSPDAEILRLDEVARGGLQPRLPSITFIPSLCKLAATSSSFASPQLQSTSSSNPAGQHSLLGTLIRRKIRAERGRVARTLYARAATHRPHPRLQSGANCEDRRKPSTGSTNEPRHARTPHNTLLGF